MSGFDVLILIPETNNIFREGDIRKTKDLLEMEDYLVEFCLPHQVEFEFPPFRIPCECIGSAHRWGINAATDRVGAFHKIWRSYKMLSKNERPEWHTYIKPWSETAITEARSSPNKWDPDPDCLYCKGWGVAETKYYPGQLYQIIGIGGGWKNLGLAGQVTKESEFQAVITPEDEVFRHWTGWQLDTYEEEEWGEKVREILQDYAKCFAIKCFMD